MLQQSHQAQASISSGQILCPFLTGYTHRPAEPHKHDDTHTHGGRKWQWRIHTQKISTHPFSPHIERERKEKMRRWRGGDVGDRARRSLGFAEDEPTWAASLPLSLHHQHPRLSLLKPFPCSFLLGSRPSRAAVLPSYLRLAGWLFVLAVGSGPGAGVVPQCVSVDGQVHRGLRRCRLRAPGLSVAKSGSNSRSGSSIRLSPRVGGASWLQLACRCDWQPRGQWQWQGPPPLLNSYPRDLRPSPSSLLYLLLGMCGRTRLLFPFHI